MAGGLLSTEDARILALESGTIRGHTCKVIVIAGDRTAEQVRTHLEGRLGVVPRLRQRLDAAMHPPAWTDDPGFSLERHVIDRGARDDRDSDGWCVGPWRHRSTANTRRGRSTWYRCRLGAPRSCGALIIIVGAQRMISESSAALVLQRAG